MFHLEQAIAEWRQRMLASGIKSPVPLEELESHLRDEIERQVNLGLKESAAFYLAVWNIGPAGLLQTEFANDDSFSRRFGDANRINDVVGLLWMVQCLWFLSNFAPMAGNFLFMPLGITWPEQDVFNITSWAEPVVFSLACCPLLNLAGVFGGFYLFCGAKRGRSVIRIIALLNGFFFSVEFLSLFLGSIPLPEHFYFWGCLQFISGLITIWLLHPPQKTKCVAE